MSIPTHEDFLSAASVWRSEHCGIGYELSWHGRSDYSPQGTWCWYIFVTNQQFRPEDFERLRLERKDMEFAGSWRRHWAYDNFPDIDAHGGWTFGEMTTYLGKDGKEYERVKVGCDYAHSWDRDGDFWQGKSAIERDVKHSIDLLCEIFPSRRERCGYSGTYDEPRHFYTAVNGSRVHKSYEQKLRESGWDKWLPAASEAA